MAVRGRDGGVLNGSGLFRLGLLERLSIGCLVSEIDCLDYPRRKLAGYNLKVL